jgi:AraC-like DNA-binding protein/tetratricopeptide (TPR) repeat protein
MNPVRYWLFISAILLGGCQQKGMKPSEATVLDYTGIIDTLESKSIIDSGRLSTLSKRSQDLEGQYDIPDSLQVRRIFASAARIRKVNPDSGFNFLLQAFDQAVVGGDSILMAHLAFKMGKWKLSEGSNQTALTFLQRSVAVFQAESMTPELARSKLAISQIQREMNDMEGAQRTSLDAIRLMEIAFPDASSEKASAYITIGNLFADIGLKDKATAYYRDAYTSSKALADTVGMSEALGNIGLLYRKNKPDSARFYYQQALTISPVEKNPFESVVFLYNLNNLSLDQKDFITTLSGYDSIMSICQKHGIYQGIPRIYSGYASVASSMGQHAKAVGYLRAARKFADSMSMTQVSHWLLKEEYEALGLAGDSPAQLPLLKRIKAIDDSVLNISKLRAVNELEIQYRTELRNREIIDLRTRLRNLGILAVLLLSMVLIAFYGLMLYRQRNKSYALLVRRYQELAESNQDPMPMDLQTEDSSVETDAAAESVTEGEQSDPEQPLSASEQLENEQTFFRFVQLMKAERLWLNPDLKVEDLAAQLGIHPRKMTGVMRAGGDLNVNQRINKYRVDEVIAHFKNPEMDHIRTDALGEMSGFSSRTHFFRVFKEFTGVTPGTFREIIRRQDAE